LSGLEGISLAAVINIIVIDLILSGDNAVVIAMAVKSLPNHLARRAAIAGAIGAVVLRVIFASLAAILLAFPAIQAVGGVILLWIAYKLLIETEGDLEDNASIDNFWHAVRVIILADLVMSLDNILAVGGAARGDVRLLIFGLLLSIPLVLFCSQILTNALKRWPWLAYLGAGVLAFTAAEMVVRDKLVIPVLQQYGAGFSQFLPALTTLAVLGAGYLHNTVSTRNTKAAAMENPALSASDVASGN
jgi:YjbE family integral membrane protein